MNHAYIMALIWGALAVLALFSVSGKGKAALVYILASASVFASLLGIAISYNLL